MRYPINIFFVLFITGALNCPAQIFSLGYRQDKKAMFQAEFNYPFLMDKNRPYNFLVGLDYTTPNKAVPSGLSPQLTFGYYVLDDEYKDYLVMAGLGTGYLFDFNKQFDNQFRITPHLYFEYLGLLNLKLGYNYMIPLQKGYPYVSIGVGGFHMFRYFRLM